MTFKKKLYLFFRTASCEEERMHVLRRYTTLKNQRKPTATFLSALKIKADMICIGNSAKSYRRFLREKTKEKQKTPTPHKPAPLAQSVERRAYNNQVMQRWVKPSSALTE